MNQSMTGTSHPLFLWKTSTEHALQRFTPNARKFFLALSTSMCARSADCTYNSSCCSFLLLAKWTKQLSVLPAIACGNGWNHYAAWHYLSLVRLYNESLWHSLHYIALALPSCYGVRRWKDLFCKGLGNWCFTSNVPFSYTSSPRWFLIINILQPMFDFSPPFASCFFDLLV